MYSACVSIGGTYLRFDTSTLQGALPQEIFRVAADVHVLVAVHADPSDDQQCRDILAHVLNDLFECLAVQQRGLDVSLLGLGDFAGDVQMRLVDLGQAAVDDFLVQLFLLLEPEHFAGFLVEDTGDAVKGGIMEIGIKGGDGFDRHVESLAQRQAGHEPAEGIGAAVDCDDDLPAGHRLDVA